MKKLNPNVMATIKLYSRFHSKVLGDKHSAELLIERYNFYYWQYLG
jgi:hypothetical protein